MSIPNPVHTPHNFALGNRQPMPHTFLNQHFQKTYIQNVLSFLPTTSWTIYTAGYYDEALPSYCSAVGLIITPNVAFLLSEPLGAHTIDFANLWAATVTTHFLSFLSPPHPTHLYSPSLSTYHYAHCTLPKNTLVPLYHTLQNNLHSTSTILHHAPVKPPHLTWPQKLVHQLAQQTCQATRINAPRYLTHTFKNIQVTIFPTYLIPSSATSLASFLRNQARKNPRQLHLPHTFFKPSLMPLYLEHPPLSPIHFAATLIGVPVRSRHTG